MMYFDSDTCYNLLSIVIQNLEVWIISVVFTIAVDGSNCGLLQPVVQLSVRRNSQATDDRITHLTDFN